MLAGCAYLYPGLLARSRKHGAACADLGRVTRALDQLGEAGDAERRASLRNENEGRLGLPFQCPQCPHFVTKQRMRSRCASLCAADVQCRALCTRPPPPVQHGGGVDLARQARRQNANSRQDCSGRQVRPAQVSAPFSKTKMKDDLASRFKCPQRPQFVPAPANSSPSSRKTYICHDLPRFKTFRSNN